MNEENKRIETPLVSAIVIIYDVEQYLDRCIRSLIEQTYSNLQIILVIDGDSGDRCPAICDMYANKDKRVVAIHGTNQGRSKARNIGLDASVGDYIFFVDGDDWLNLDFVEHMLKLHFDHSIDIAICNFNMIEEGKETIQTFDNSRNHYIEMSGTDALVEMWYEKYLNIAPWGKLYKKKLWDNMRFDNYRYYEDLAFMHKVILQAGIIGYDSDYSGVNYLIRKNSSTRQFSPERLVAISIVDNNIEYAKNISVLLYKAALAKAVATYFHILFQLPQSDDKLEIRTQIIQKIKKERNAVLLDGNVRKKTKCGLCLSYFGFGFAEKIFKFLY